MPAGGRRRRSEDLGVCAVEPGRLLAGLSWEHTPVKTHDPLRDGRVAT